MLNENQNKKLDKYNERFNRWHDKQLNLMTFAINLFLTLGVASIGFIFKNFKDALFGKLIFNEFSVGRTVSILILFSILAGIVALFSRLFDFRRTKDIVKYRKKEFRLREGLIFAEENIDSVINKRKLAKKVSNFLGKLTWYSFFVQVGLFLISMIILVFNI